MLEYVLRSLWMRYIHRKGIKRKIQFVQNLFQYVDQEMRIEAGFTKRKLMQQPR